MFTKNKTKFEWLAQESAPREYPMRVIDGTFYYHGQNHGLYVPTAASITPGWGNGRSVHVVGDDYKTLPDRLDIRFYSFWENQLYHGSFELPYERILALFQEGVARDKEFPIFRYIVVGMAPGGVVAVWVQGRGETREVFFGQAQPYEADMYNPMGSHIDDTQEYAESYLEDLPPDIYARVKKEGIPFGLWAQYRKTYPWRFAVSSGDVPSIGVGFLNGENYRTAFPFHGQQAMSPVPSAIGFTARFPNDKTQYVYGINFDYIETRDAMEKLSANGQQVQVIVNPALPEPTSTISLTNGQETIQLKKLTHD